MELRDLIRVLRRRAILIISGLFLGGVAALTFSLIQPPTFIATAKVFVSVQQASSLQDLSQGSTFTQQVVKSYADVVATPIVLDPVRRRLKLTDTSDQLSRQITATASPDTVVLTIAVSSRSAREAAVLANAISEQLTTVVDQLTPSTAGDTSPVKLTILQPAMLPLAPDSPRPFLNAAIGALLGLLVGVAIALTRERFDTKIRRERDIASVSDAPMLGLIPFDPDAAKRPLVVHDARLSVRAEAFRSLRTNLQFLQFADGHRQLVVTSSIASEGKTTSAVNLALSLAEVSGEVLLIDADLRRPKVADYLGIDGSVGLTDVLIGAVQLEQAVQRWGQSELHVLPGGQLPPNPNELLQSEAMIELLAKVTKKYSTVILDAPPLLPVSDAAILARRTSGALVVCAVGRVHRPELHASMAALAKVGAPVLGTIATMVPGKGPDAYAYGGYGYGYGYGSGVAGGGERE